MTGGGGGNTQTTRNSVLQGRGGLPVMNPRTPPQQEKLRIIYRSTPRYFFSPPLNFDIIVHFCKLKSNFIIKINSGKKYINTLTLFKCCECLQID